jgi:hypothetical protein
MPGINLATPIPDTVTGHDLDEQGFGVRVPHESGIFTSAYGPDKRKAKPSMLTGRRGLLGCEMLRIPQYLDNRLPDGGKIFSFKHRPRSKPQKHYFSASGTYLCHRLNKPQSPSRLEGLGKLEKKIIHLIGSPTHDLPACSKCLNHYATACLLQCVPGGGGHLPGGSDWGVKQTTHLQLVQK